MTEVRLKNYRIRIDAHKIRRGGRIKKLDDPGGSGSEIVREVLACSRCAARASRIADRET